MVCGWKTAPPRGFKGASCMRFHGEVTIVIASNWMNTRAFPGGPVPSFAQKFNAFGIGTRTLGG